MKFPIFVLLSVTLASCATPYQKNSTLSRGGYEEEKIDENSYHLTFIGNGFTNQAQVNEMWLRRATELCNGQPKTVKPSTNTTTTEMTTATGGAFVTSNPSKTVANGTVVCK